MADPKIIGKIPNDAGSEEGYQKHPVINLKIEKTLKNANPSLNKNAKIRTTKTIDTMPHIKIIASIKVFIIFLILYLSI
jgi:hypothetical protein